jgi:hypothetical protein
VEDISGEGGEGIGGGEGDIAKDETALEKSCASDCDDPWACRKALYDSKHLDIGWLWWFRSED